MSGEEDEGFNVFADDDGDMDAGISKHIDGAIEAQDGVSEGDETREGNAADGEAQTQEGQRTATDGTAPQSDGQEGAGRGRTQDAAGQPVQQPSEQSPSPSRVGPPVRSDQHGNLTDAQGNIVVRAGSERRFFETAQKYGKRVQQLEQERTTLQQQVESTKALDGLPAQFSLNNDEVKLGMHFAKSIRDNPVNTARWALQEVMKMGHSLESIVGNAAGQQSLSMEALAKLVDEKLKPFTSQQEQQTQQAQQRQQAEHVYNEFIQKHEHSTVHQRDIARVMQSADKPSAEVAYWRLREYAARNGLDFAQPLGPQVQARQQQRPQQNNGHAQPAPNAQQNGMQPAHTPAPMPNGAAPPSATNPDEVMSHPDDAWDSIITQSMRQSGMQ